MYTSISESRVGSAERDVINGFDRGGDKIDLSAMDANLGRAGEGAFTFVGTSGFSGTAGELRLQGLGGANAVLVEGDLRGDGVADFQIFVNLTTVLGAGTLSFEPLLPPVQCPFYPFQAVLHVAAVVVRGGIAFSEWASYIELTIRPTSRLTTANVVTMMKGTKKAHAL